MNNRNLLFVQEKLLAIDQQLARNPKSSNPKVKMHFLKE